MNEYIIRKKIKTHIGADYCKIYNKQSICIKFKYIKELFNKLIDNIFIKKTNKHIETLEKQIILKRMIKLKTIYDYMITTNEYFLIPIYKIFGMVTIENMNKYKVVHIKDINNFKLSQQNVFTYSVKTLLDKCFPDENLCIETEKYLYQLLKEEGLDMIDKQNITEGPRLDIIIRNIRLIIEVDEKQHNSYNHIMSDKDRDMVVNDWYFDVIRYNIKHDSIIDILDKIIISIKNQISIYYPEKIYEMIIFTFCNMGYDKKLIEYYFSKEEFEEIQNNISSEKCGLIPKNLTLSELKSHINIDDDDENIITIIDDIRYPIIIRDDEIYLSPKARDEVLSELPRSTYEQVRVLHRLSSHIKTEFMSIIYNINIIMHRKMLSNKESRQHIAIESYNRGRISIEKENIKLEKKYKDQCDNITELNNIINSRLSTDAHVFDCKQNIGDYKSKLVKNECIIPEIPELVYTNDMNDYVEISKIKTIYSVKKAQINKFRCFTKCKLNLLELFDISKKNSGKVLHRCKLI